MLDALLSPALLTAVALALSHGRFVDARAESSFRELSLHTGVSVLMSQPHAKGGLEERRTDTWYLAHRAITIPR